MWAAVQGFFTIAVVVAVGYALVRARLLPDSAQQALGEVAFYVGQPALVLVAVAHADLNLLFGWHVVAFGVACVGSGLAFAAISARRWRATRGESVVAYLSTSYVNAGNLGIPISAFMLGDPAWAAPAMLLQVLVLQPSAVAMLETSSAGKSVFKSFVTHPLVLGGVVGLSLNLTGWQPPPAIWEPLVLLSELAIPAMLLAFGMSLRSSPLPRLNSLTPQQCWAIVTKALIVPLIALGVGLALHLSGTALRAAVILAALPTAQVVFVHALRYGVGLRLVQTTTVYATAACVPVILAVGALIH